MLPNFLIIGAAKAGTTSLYHYVGDHPEAFVSAKKELSFFCTEFNWSRGIHWYESQFRGSQAAIAIGEASPRYTVHPLYQGVAKRIASVLPAVRLIYIVREPIERMQSQYLDNVMHGLENDPVEEALERNPFYLTSSKYSLQLEQYAEHFSTDRILVIRSDDLKRDREKTMSSVYAFLGIDPTWRAPVLSQEFLQMRNRRAPLPVFRGFWKSAFRRRLGPYLPRMLKDRLLHVTSRPVDTGAASISPTFRRHLEVLLKDEVKGLYAFMDERFDGWGIA